MERRTRIVATLGPATDPPGVLESLLRSGLDIARINAAHGTMDEHYERIHRLRAIADSLPRPIAVLLDLPGPKLRACLKEPLSLIEGHEVTLGTRQGTDADLGITEPGALEEIRPDQRILLDDGRLQLRVLRSQGEVVIARVITGGTLLPGKGINLPDTNLSIPSVTARDREALALAARGGVDWLGLSFVRSAGAAEEVRALVESNGLRLPILAKIERPEAVKHAAAIIREFDGIMVARGDLGVEIALERVPHIQKHLINLARLAGKPVITATDMLDSMRDRPRPTRAEVSDVANSIYDGTDAVMLSGETAVGRFPLEVFQTMDRIVREAETHMQGDQRFDLALSGQCIEDHISHLTCVLARNIRADAILTPAFSGRTARLVARHRPQTPIVVPVGSPSLCRQLMLSWGLTPVPLEGVESSPDRLAEVVQAAYRAGAVGAGALVVVLAGNPVEGGGRFPTIRVVRVGSAGESCEP